MRDWHEPVREGLHDNGRRTCEKEKTLTLPVLELSFDPFSVRPTNESLRLPHIVLSLAICTARDLLQGGG